MTVGAWYVAIEFQLFVLLNVLVWGLWRLGARHAAVIVSVALLCLASQWYFNRDAEWDRWALYFFESYGLGALLANRTLRLLQDVDQYFAALTRYRAGDPSPVVECFADASFAAGPKRSRLLR